MLNQTKCYEELSGCFGRCSLLLTPLVNICQDICGWIVDPGLVSSSEARLFKKSGTIQEPGPPSFPLSNIPGTLRTVNRCLMPHQQRIKYNKKFLTSYLDFEN